MLKIKKVNYESENYGGCETCDWGSSYISNIEIISEDDTVIKIETNQMYEYMLSEEDYMIAIGKSNDLEELILNLLKEIENASYNLALRVGLCGMSFSINEKEIDMLKSLNEEKIIYEKVVDKDV